MTGKSSWRCLSFSSCDWMFCRRRSVEGQDFRLSKHAWLLEKENSSGLRLATWPQSRYWWGKVVSSFEKIWQCSCSYWMGSGCESKYGSGHDSASSLSVNILIQTYVSMRQQLGHLLYEKAQEVSRLLLLVPWRNVLMQPSKEKITSISQSTLNYFDASVAYIIVFHLVTYLWCSRLAL